MKLHGVPIIKILHVNDSYTEQGGAEQYLLSVADLLKSVGHENVILYSKQQPQTIQDGPWPAYRVADTSRIPAQIERIIEAERPDVAYTHHVASADLVKAVSNNLPTAAYIHNFAAVCPGLGKYFRVGDTVCQRAFGWGCAPMHYLRRCSDARRPSTLWRRMNATAQLRGAYRALPRILVPTTYMKLLLTQNKFNSDRIGILPPCVFPDNSLPVYEPPLDSSTIVYAGRLEIEKGVPYLLRAMTGLPVTARLIVAGDGTLRSRYERMVGELGLHERVKFTGWLVSEDMERLYKRCSLIVIPSICPESFGKSGVEALSYGRPVVAFDVGGIHAWLENGVNGYLVRPRDVTVLANRIAQLLGDPLLAERMGQAGQAMCARHYRASDHLATLFSAFDDVRKAFS